ncbi:MAG: ribonuclease E/G [Alphaproteobacteria bacterium]|nr:ribonuclease E/G [Alphaproteobacteria bacterium]
MAKKMLIDATHSEETRVVVLDGNRLEDFEVETSTKKQKKGNIYLAKITRVEPSLQAAFIDYGEDRHGFLAFNEIHPDYYQISEEDSETLLAENNEKELSIDESEDSSEENQDETPEITETADEADENALETPEIEEEEEEEETEEDIEKKKQRQKLKRLTRQFKIQDVIKRRQIVLVQVTKEERGNKGAALTTYISMAGRYCVLMPNNFKGGGISRRITNIADRKNFKSIIKELTADNDMAVIVRTAGKGHSRDELKIDYNYLARSWEKIRTIALKKSSPAIIHEEANLIKRAIRDTNISDLEEVLVDGESEYHTTKNFIKMLSPNSAKKVHLYKDKNTSLFCQYQIEKQLDALHSTGVPLKSGGSLVINPTEALVSIDVNSGKATHEHNIEETALHTNLEAADEVARQLKLRDLAGLVVIDFIDMYENKNNREVENRMKNALKKDRARIQMGKISGFGLMELSRQRLHSSFMESNYQVCPHCNGRGMIRSVESAAMHILRTLEEENIRKSTGEITITVMPTIALYLLNNKRTILTEMEERHRTKISINSDDDFIVMTDYRVETVKKQEEQTKKRQGTEESVKQVVDSERHHRRGRRKHKQSESDSQKNEPSAEVSNEIKETEIKETKETETEENQQNAQNKSRRRRGSRGGRNRRNRKNKDNTNQETNNESLNTSTEKQTVENKPDSKPKLSRFDRIRNKMLGKKKEETKIEKPEPEIKPADIRKGWWQHS